MGNENQSGETQEAETVETSPSQEAPQDDGFVELTEASDEDIQAFLDGELKAEASQEPDPETEQGEESEKGETSEATEEKSQDTSEEETQEASQKISPEYVKKLEEQLEQKEKFIKRRSNELGDLRKQLKEKNDILAQKLGEEEFLSDPSAAVDAKLEIKENEDKLEAIEIEQAAMVASLENQKAVQRHIPNKEWNLKGMVQCLEEDGVDPDIIKGFANNPYTTDAVTLVQLHKRQKAENLLRQVAVFAKEQQKQIEELKAKPHKILKSVESNLSKPAPVSSATGGSSQVRQLSVDESELADISDDELNAILEQRSS